MKIPVTKIVETGRVSVILLTVFALAVCGATAAERQAALIAAHEASQHAESAIDLLEPTVDEEGRGEMAPGKSFNVEPSAWFVPTVTAKTGNDNPRVKREAPSPRQPLVLTSRDLQATVLAGSPTLVSSRLGRQFTLVGAKPSGTS